MSHEFQFEKEMHLAATPEQVWDAIATGPGVDSWFMGKSEVEPREGGSTYLTMLGQTQTSTITAWSPAKQFAHRSTPAPDGMFMAFEYLIESRDGGTTTLRLVQSGVLGDDWESEYKAMQAGWPMYLDTLVAYLTYFCGRAATPITGVLPGAGSAADVWMKICAQFGLSGEVSVGAGVQLDAAGLPPIVGVVDCVSPLNYLGVRTEDGLYRFLYSGADRGSAVVIGHHLFAVVDAAATENAWQMWLSSTFAT